MNNLVKASAGTMESSDVYIELSPCEAGTDVHLESVVFAQFGDEILRVIDEELKANGVDGVKLNVVDKGALECTLRARLETVISRAKGGCHA